jgi:hypothetical protein
MMGIVQPNRRHSLQLRELLPGPKNRPDFPITMEDVLCADTGNAHRTKQIRSNGRGDDGYTE